MLRLLEKREIDQKRAEQERARNNEGAKLAKKVEQVRELAAETKSAYERYRVNALEAIQKELAPLYEERDKLKTDIKEKRAEWDALLQPLDKQFALYVKTEREKIETEQSRQAAEAAKINRLHQEQEQKERELDKKAKENEKGRIAADRMRNDAQVALSKSELALIQAQKEAALLIEDAESQVKAAKKQVQETAIKAQEVQNRSNALDAREKNLEDREMAVIIKELQQYSPVKSYGKSPDSNYTDHGRDGAKR